MCKVLNMTRQNYYKYRNTKDKDYYDYLEIKRVFEEGKQLYGARRIKEAILIDTGWIINIKKIRRVYVGRSSHPRSRTLLHTLTKPDYRSTRTASGITTSPMAGWSAGTR